MEVEKFADKIAEEKNQLHDRQIPNPSTKINKLKIENFFIQHYIFKAGLIFADCRDKKYFYFLRLFDIIIT